MSLPLSYNLCLITFIERIMFHPDGWIVSQHAKEDVLYFGAVLDGGADLSIFSFVLILLQLDIRQKMAALNDNWCDQTADVWSSWAVRRCRVLLFQ